MTADRARDAARPLAGARLRERADAAGAALADALAAVAREADAADRLAREAYEAHRYAHACAPDGRLPPDPCPTLAALDRAWALAGGVRVDVERARERLEGVGAPPDSRAARLARGGEA